MSNKIKIQVGKILDQRIKDAISKNDDSSLKDVAKAYIIGFINGNSINYVGLSQQLTRINDSLNILGIAYLRDKPNIETIQHDIEQLITYLNELSQDDSLRLLTETLDLILNNILIYHPDEGSSIGLSKIIWTKDGPIDKLPKISVLESNKIYAHSSLMRLTIPFQLDIVDNDMQLNDTEKLCKSIDNVQNAFEKESKQFNFLLKNSKFCSNSLEVKSLTENLYDHLIPPDDVTSLDDILSQTTSNKKEREAAIKKVCDKWRNKQKESRAPLEFEVTNQAFIQTNGLKFSLNVYIYVHMNDSLSATFRKILSTISSNIALLQSTFVKNSSIKLSGSQDLNLCSFKPVVLDHLVYSAYLITESGVPDYDFLEATRDALHELYLAPRIPLFRLSQSIKNLNMMNPDELKGYLCNVHHDIATKSGINNGIRNIIDGTYTYHHYMQNGINDSGWGCAYRSLQTIISWFKHQAYIYSDDVKPYTKVGHGVAGDKMDQLRAKLRSDKRVPNHEEIQSVLVDIGDKQPEFIGSKKWIGSQEVCFVLDHLYGISSKFIAVNSGSELVGKARDLGTHIKSQSTPVMIGGGVLAHTIIGTDFNEKNGDISYLILDPHYTDHEDLDKILKKGWCGWKKNSFWDKTAFYNLCLPQRPDVI